MSRDWKPGDVALVQPASADRPVAAIRTGSDQWYAALKPGEPSFIIGDRLTVSARPLIVLDLNEQSIRRVVEVLREKGLDLIAEQIEAQAAPPKPDEPRGLGAVVEDTDGQRWVRVEDPYHSWVRSMRDEGEYTQRTKWEYITAVRVLSEGVQP